MRRQDQRLRWLEALTAVVLGLGFATQAARGECVSPSVVEGATTTTIYRCSEQQQPTAKSSPLIVEPDKSTVVERGSPDVPWFEPKPTKTEDPIETAKKPAEQPADVSQKPIGEPAEVSQKPVEKPAEVSQKPVEKPAEVSEEPVKETALPKPPQEEIADKVEAASAPPQATEAKPVKPKIVKAKRSKSKLVKAKRTKTKVAKTPKRTKTKVAKAKRSTTRAGDASAKSEADSAKDTTKAEPAKSDDKVIVWTKKDMPLGNRIKNWLGF